MKLSVGWSSVALLLCAASTHAQLYKWVGPDGKVNYTDTPPPATVKQVEKKAGLTGNVADADLPYELVQASRNNPVTLYTTNPCLPCDDGRKLLNARGIPYSEKTISTNNDIAQLRQLSGDSQLPVLFVGRSKEAGFEPGAWNRALTVGGYPATSRLPANYRKNPPEAAAQPQKAAPAPQQNDADEESRIAVPQGASDLPAPSGNAPPGFRF